MNQPMSGYLKFFGKKYHQECSFTVTTAPAPAQSGMFFLLRTAKFRVPARSRLHFCPHVFPAPHPLAHRSMASAAYTEAWLSGPAATQFYTRTYLPPAGTAPRAVVVAVHGFAEHIGRYAHFHPRVAARGIAVFAFDQRGFGLTGQDTTGKRSKDSAYGKTSWREQMGDVAWALGHAGTAFAGVPVFLYGHSMVCVVGVSLVSGVGVLP